MPPSRRPAILNSTTALTRVSGCARWPIVRKIAHNRTLRRRLPGNCQMLWIGGGEVSQAATFSSVIPSSWLSSSVTRMPSLNFTPSSTSATRWWPLNRRQRSWAVVRSL